MTLQELRFIIALAREKHFRKAADACFVSQPTLSVAVQKLEKELDTVLFERYKNTVKITPSGKQIVELAKRALENVESIKQAAKTDKNQLTDTFKLGAIFTIGPYLFPPLITSLNKLAPEMPLEIQENYTANLREKLISGELDAIIISLPFTDPGIATHTLYEEPFVVLMPGDHPLAKHKTIHEKDLSHHNLLMLGEGHCFRDQVVSSCPLCFSTRNEKAKMHWQTVEGSSLETIRHMVASKMGLTILPKTAALSPAYQGDMLTVRPLRGATPSRSVALAWRKSFPRDKAIGAIIKCIIKHFPQKS